MGQILYCKDILRTKRDVCQGTNGDVGGRVSEGVVGDNQSVTLERKLYAPVQPVREENPTSSAGETKDRTNMKIRGYSEMNVLTLILTFSRNA